MIGSTFDTSCRIEFVGIGRHDDLLSVLEFDGPLTSYRLNCVYQELMWLLSFYGKDYLSIIARIYRDGMFVKKIVSRSDVFGSTVWYDIRIDDQVVRAGKLAE